MIGARLRARREALGLGQIPVSIDLEVSLRTYGNWEQGRLHGLTVRDLKKISAFLEVEVGALAAEWSPVPQGEVAP